MLGFTWKQYFYVLLGLIISFAILQFWILPDKNASICEDYFLSTFDIVNDDGIKCSEAYRYNSRTHICSCEDGKYYLDMAMILEENERKTMIWELESDESIRRQHEELNDQMNRLNLSSLIS